MANSCCVTYRAIQLFDKAMTKEGILKLHGDYFYGLIKERGRLRRAGATYFHLKYQAIDNQGLTARARGRNVTRRFLFFQW